MNISKNIIHANIDQLSTQFGNLKFDGIVTEPILLPFFKKIPKYNDVEEIVENRVIPTYSKAFNIFSELLKEQSRVVITAPSILTIDGGRIRVYLNEIAEKSGFHRIRVLNKKGIAEKSDRNLKLESKKNVVYDSGTKYFRREFYIFEKN